MGVWIRLLGLLASARQTRASVEAARQGLHTLKTTAQGVRTAAFQRIRERALAGEASAQLAMGEYYYDGRAVPQDYAEAFRWFLQAAEHGQAQAQLNVGLMLSIGRGIAQDGAEACRWWYLAAGQGHQPAKDLLAKANQRMSPHDLAEGARRAKASRPAKGPSPLAS